ncbi:hypothetical protein DPMN_159775 [Dreissena polymorpha]|uniref:Uncharacterized protein n=1 Tax=Dreissena polymorpha TaxID=45954 RepID=A0A9D4IN59_DREPO|nr:hypothetical protein DPMN_159775 [Dreissena polymorpha]
MNVFKRLTGPTYFILVCSTLQQLLITEDDCLVKGSAISKFSDVGGRCCSMSGDRIMKDILADTYKGENSRSAPKVSC